MSIVQIHEGPDSFCGCRCCCLSLVSVGTWRVTESMYDTEQREDITPLMTELMNQTKWLMIPACPSLVCFFFYFLNKGSIKGTKSLAL